MTLSPAQFGSVHKDQMQFPGLESPPQAPAPKKSRGELHQSLGITQSKAPAGMRGSIGDRAGLQGRIAKKKANEGRWESNRARLDDENAMEDDDYEEPNTHPKTGLPAWGNIPTHEAPISMGNKGGSPMGMTFHGSSRSARRAAGRVTEVPIVGERGNINTRQGDVSSTRLHQAMEDPSTRSSPRFPQQFKEYPHVYTQHQSEGEHLEGPQAHQATVIDGNHRIAGAILRGEMFQPVNLLTPDAEDEVDRRSEKIGSAKRRAENNPRRNPDAEQKLNERYYGEDY